MVFYWVGWSLEIVPKKRFAVSNSFWCHFTVHICGYISIIAYETRSCDMSIKSRLLNSAIPPQSSSRGVLCVIIEFWVFMFLNTLIIQESNSVGSFC